MSETQKIPRSSYELPLLQSIAEMGGEVVPGEELYQKVAVKMGFAGQGMEYYIGCAMPSSRAATWTAAGAGFGRLPSRVGSASGHRSRDVFPPALTLAAIIRAKYAIIALKETSLKASS